MVSEGYIRRWICLKFDVLSAECLGLILGVKITIKDVATYGTFIFQGHEIMDASDIETIGRIRFCEFTHDEYFVSKLAAKEGGSNSCVLGHR